MFVEPLSGEENLAGLFTRQSVRIFGSLRLAKRILQDGWRVDLFEDSGILTGQLRVTKTHGVHVFFCRRELRYLFSSIYTSVLQIRPLSPHHLLSWRIVFSLFHRLRLASSGHEYSTTDQAQQSLYSIITRQEKCRHSSTSKTPVFFFSRVNS